MIARSINEATENALVELAEMARVHDTDLPPPRHTVITVTTVVETFVDRMLQTLIGASGVREHPFGRALVDRVGDDFYRSWDERFHWLSRAFGIAIAGTAEAQDLKTLIDLRNALIHGGGHLTARQARDLGELLALESRLRRALDVQVEGGVLAVSNRTGRAAIDVARAFLISMDTAWRSLRARSFLQDGYGR